MGSKRRSAYMVYLYIGCGYMVNTGKSQKNSSSSCIYTYVILIALYYNLQLDVIVIKVSYKL